jgi:biotin carboxyl carrier protein
MAELDSDTIRYALKTVREFGFHSVRLKTDESEFRAIMDLDAVCNEDSDISMDMAVSEVAEPAETVLTSPVVGYFSASPRGKKGAKLDTGDVIGSVTALGFPNDVSATKPGQIVEMKVKEGDAVEYGQAIAVVKHD